MARFILIIAVLLAMAQGAWAQGNGDGNNGNGNGNSEAGNNAGGNGNGNANGAENGNGNSANGNNGDSQGNNGNGNGNGNSNGGGNGGGSVIDDLPGAPEIDIPPEAPVSPPGASAEEQALEAVQSGRSVPLESLLPDIRARTGGQIIDAQLLTVNGFLLYGIKVLTPSGRVGTEYYYARSGQHVEKR